MLQISSCKGGNEGYVNLTIMPSPPYISSLEILQQEDFHYLECDAKIMGNNPSDYNTVYTWDADGAKVGEGKSLEVKGTWREITCSAETHDSKMEGDSKEKTIIIVRSSITGKAVDNFAEGAGFLNGWAVAVSIALCLSLAIAYLYYHNV
jgi:hypothetical protein